MVMPLKGCKESRGFLKIAAQGREGVDMYPQIEYASQLHGLFVLVSHSMELLTEQELLMYLNISN